MPAKTRTPRIPSTPQLVRRSATRVRIVNEILQLIRGNNASLGARLPSEPALAAQLSVSRPSLREALSVLETLGVLEIKRGSGVFVKDPGAAEVAGDVSSIRRTAISAKETEQFADVLHRIRLIIEPLAAELAAINAGKEDLSLMRFQLGQLAEAAKRGDMVAAAHADVAFHNAICSASGSRILVNVLRAMEEPLRSARELRLGAFWDETFVVRTHLSIFKAIERRNGAQAQRAMTRHLRDVDRLTSNSHNKGG